MEEIKVLKEVSGNVIILYSDNRGLDLLIYQIF